MALHPVIRSALDSAIELRTYSEMPIAQAREQAMLAYRNMPPPLPVGAVQDRLIPGPGGTIAVRIYAPRQAGPHPVLVFFHGSGFVVLGLDSHDDLCRRICVGASCVLRRDVGGLPPRAGAQISCRTG